MRVFVLTWKKTRITHPFSKKAYYPLYHISPFTNNTHHLRTISNTTASIHSPCIGNGDKACSSNHVLNLD